MSSKIGLKLTRKYSINFTLTKRSKKMIKFVIIHYTGMKSESSAIKKLCDAKSNVSSHYYIKYNGDVLQLVPEPYEAWHAGKSTWKNYNSINKYSIGIEISNPGHQYRYKTYTRQQITSLKKLLKHLMKKYNIKRQAILGHSDIAPDRKKDPGEKFPWNELAKIKLSWTHSLDVKKLKQFRKIRLSSSLEKISFFNNLRKLGYMRINLIRSKKKTNFLIKAFQRRFRQDLVNGIIDKECFLISKNLLKQ
tara:strand:- start:92 stop:838 length:747 start_codon:yes stop_codon:yes gene_type:complete